MHCCVKGFKNGSFEIEGQQMSTKQNRLECIQILMK